MNKGKIARLAGFVGVLGVTTVLITTAVTGTGAYFSDSHGGNLNGTSGHLAVDVGGDGLNISFDNLIPGVDRTSTVTFTPTSVSPTVDVWMTFDTTSYWYGMFTGTKNVAYTTGSATTSDGGMGQYGHFKVRGAQGYQFESYNLQLAASNPTNQGACQVDANGDGGNSAQHVLGAGTDLPECGVPGAILIAHNVAAGDTGSAVITFGLTGKQTQQGQTNDPNVGFHIVATQVGQNPSVTW